MTWNARKASKGKHVITATAYDKAGKVETAAIVCFLR
jgi:hypothetical protein